MGLRRSDRVLRHTSGWFVVKKTFTKNLVFKVTDLNKRLFQYFLSKRSLYLVVWKMTDGKKGMNEIQQWLINIQARYN